MRKIQTIIIVLSFINVLSYIYYSTLNNKIQSQVDFYENFSSAVVNGETDIDKLQCLFNAKSLPSILDMYTQESLFIKGEFEYFSKHAKNGRIVDSRITNDGYFPSASCLSTSQRVYNYKINKRLTEHLYNIKRYMLGASAADYISSKRITIINDETTGYCDIAIMRSKPIEYNFDFTVNGQLVDSYYEQNRSIANSTMKDGVISVTVIDPCDESKNRDFRLKI